MTNNSEEKNETRFTSSIGKPNSKFKKPVNLFIFRAKPKPAGIFRKSRPVFRQVSPYYKIGAVIFFISVLAGFFGYFVFFSDYFKIKNIEVRGAQKFVNSKDLTEIAGQNLVGKNILFADYSNLHKNVLSIFHGAKNIEFAKRFPDTVEVTVTERQPIALVHNSNSDEFFLIDTDGYILGQVADTNTSLPKVVYEGMLKIGLAINKQMIPEYLEIFDALNAKNLKSSSMSFYPRYVQIYLDDGLQIFIGEDKKKRESVEVISDLIKQLRLEGRNVAKIDLRYDKVIVEY